MTRDRARLAGGLGAAAGLIAVTTLASRVVGFGRWLVFSHSVGTTCVGNVYATANQVPNVVFEVAAGGALAAVAVPIVAGQLRRGDHDAVTRTASALLTWALTLLVPLALLVAVFARPLTAAMLGGQPCPGALDLAASMLVVFAPQVALYGLGIVLSGVLQAHRRFLSATLAPLLSSLVVIGAYVLYGALAGGHGDDLAALPTSAAYALSVGTTLGVVALSLPLLVPVRRAGVRLSLTWRFPVGVARRAASLAGAGVIALVAQQLAVLATTWVANHRGGTGTINVYTYVQAVYLLPYAVLAVPIAMSAFPALASHVVDEEAAAPGPRPAQQPAPDQERRAGAAAATLSKAARAVVVVGFVGAAGLAATAGPVGAFFGILDAGRARPAGRAVLAAMPDALLAFAPGLVGFGLAAVLTRAVYVRGRPGVAAAGVSAGWLVAALWPLATLHGRPGPGETLRTLGLASSTGMTLSAALLLLGTRRAWGAGTLRGVGRTLLAAAVGAALGVLAGRAVAGVLPDTTLVLAVLAGVASAAVAVAVFAVVVMVGDPEAARMLRSRLGRSRAGSAVSS